MSVVPGEIDASKFSAGPVRGDFIVCGEGLEEVVSVLSADVLDAKIIDDKDKHDWAPFVSPQARGGGTLVVAMRFQSGHEEVVG